MVERHESQIWGFCSFIAECWNETRFSRRKDRGKKYLEAFSFSTMYLFTSLSYLVWKFSSGFINFSVLIYIFSSWIFDRCAASTFSNKHNTKRNLIFYNSERNFNFLHLYCFIVSYIYICIFEFISQCFRKNNLVMHFLKASLD